MNRPLNFKNRVNRFVYSFHQEILKTGHIGKKLITAGRTNSHLKDSYEELGRLIESKIDLNELEINDHKVKALMHTIKACKKDLKEIEDQVNQIKFCSSPIDISKNENQD
jgi:hypothetical protein